MIFVWHIVIKTPAIFFFLTSKAALGKSLADETGSSLLSLPSLTPVEALVHVTREDDIKHTAAETRVVVM